MTDGRYTHDRYTVRRKILTVLGAKFHVFDDEGRIVFFSQMKAFKLKEDIRLFAGEAMEQELLSIRARSVIDFAATYDIVDTTTGEPVGSVRRRGLKSMFRDEWLLMDVDGREIGRISEDSAIKATLRRLHELVAMLVPQQYHITTDGQTLGTMRQTLNPFVMKLEVDLAADETRRLDRRLALAAAILLCAVEGKQG